MPLTLLGTPSPVYLIGESHTLIFRNLLFRAGDAGQLFQTRIRYLPHVLAQNFFAPAGGAFHADLIAALRAEELLRADLTPSHHSFDGATISGAWMEKRAIVAPALVLCLGDLDLHHLLGQFAGYDFELPGDVHYGADRSQRPVAYATIRAELEKLLSPLVQGLRVLRSAGFTRTLVHCIPPRTTDDSATLRWTKAPKAVRAKLTVMANDILSRACASLEIPFIDIWPETCKDGYLLPQFDLDGTHLTTAAAHLSLDKISAALYANNWNTHNQARYRQAAAQAARHQAAAADAASQPAPSLSIGQLDAPWQALQAADAGYSAAPPLAPRLDWCATPAAGHGALQSAQPNAEQLALALELLGQGAGQAVLQGAAEYAMTVSSFRPSRLAAGSAPLILAHTAQSGSMRKAVLRLGGDGVIGFVSAGGEILHTMRNAPGALAVYDPAVVRCVLDAESGDISLVEIALTPLLPGQPFRVVWSGQHEWPLDPFQYSVAGMQAHPPFDGEQVTVRALPMD